ncbi:phage holin family protein [Nonomuraea dietziae]|uniref:phage holin family protein n=1 Tax=Nonomuraea dietziae TaxID=65515 RepID=UPI003404839F
MSEPIGRPDRSIGELVGEIGEDLSKLFRQEVALARAEIKEEARKAAKAGGMFGGAGFAGVMTAVLLSLALVFGLANVMDAGWASLIVAALWAVVGAVLYGKGRTLAREVSVKPEQTVETLKEDARWARDLTR